MKNRSYKKKFQSWLRTLVCFVVPNQKGQPYITKFPHHAGQGPVIHFSFSDQLAVGALMEKLIITALSHPTPSARVVAFECLPRIAALHYDILAPYFTQIGEPWCKALQTETFDEIRLAIIEFWSVLCEVEGERHTANQAHHNFITAAAPHLVPILFEIQVAINQVRANWRLCSGFCSDLFKIDRAKPMKKNY